MQDLKIILSKGLENNMIHLLKFEFRKLTQAKSFYICGLIVIAMVVISNLMTNAMSGSEFFDSSSLSASFAVKGFVGNSMILMITGIFTALFVCEDEQSGTLKNIYAKGYSRSSVFFAKYMVSLLSMGIMASLGLTIAFGHGLFLWGFEGEITSHSIKIFLAQVLLLLAYHSFYFVIASVTGKSGTAIAYNIVGPMLVGMVASMADAFLKLKNVTLSEYWLETLLSNVQAEGVTQSVLMKAGIMAITYILVFLVVGRGIAKKKEL